MWQKRVCGHEPAESSFRLPLDPSASDPDVRDGWESRSETVTFAGETESERGCDELCDETVPLLRPLTPRPPPCCEPGV